jgi:hypothetical protein
MNIKSKYMLTWLLLSPAMLSRSEFKQWVQCSCQCWNQLPVSVSAIVESHEHAGNDTLIICNRKPRFHLLLWLSRRDSFGHRWLYPPVPGTNSCCCFCLSVNKWSTDFTNCTAICCSFKPYCRTVCHVSIRGITCQWSPKWYFIGCCCVNLNVHNL